MQAVQHPTISSLLATEEHVVEAVYHPTIGSAYPCLLINAFPTFNHCEATLPVAAYHFLSLIATLYH